MRTTLGKVTTEIRYRLGEEEEGIRVFGVDREEGLTSSTKYQSSDLSRYKRISPGDFAYNPMRLNIGSIGICTPSHGDGVVSPDYVVFRCDKTSLNPMYFHYHLKTTQWSNWVTGQGEGSVRERIYFRKLAEYEFDLPSLSYQGRLVHILSSLDDKIDLNRRMNESLEAMTRAIFKDWFVDFGPTRAKSEGRTPYLAPELWNLFPNALDDEDKPLGWTTYMLSDLARHHRATLSPSAQPDRIYEHYSIPAYDAGKEPANDLGGSIKSNKTIVPKSAVLLSKLNPDIERVWLPNPDGGAPQVASTEFLALTPLEPATRSALYCLFRSPDFRAEMAARVTGTSKSHQRVQPKSLLACEILDACPRLLALFDEKVSPMMAQLLANRHESCELARTRDLLLPRLMSGEIRLRDAERAVETVV